MAATALVAGVGVSVAFAVAIWRFTTWNARDAPADSLEFMMDFLTYERNASIAPFLLEPTHTFRPKEEFGEFCNSCELTDLDFRGVRGLESYVVRPRTLREIWVSNFAWSIEGKAQSSAPRSPLWFVARRRRTEAWLGPAGRRLYCPHDRLTSKRSSSR